MATPIADTKGKAATAASARPAATKPAKAGKRTPWRVLGEKIEGYLDAMKKLQAIAKLPAPAGHEAVWKKLGEQGFPLGNTPAIMECLIAMDAARVPLAKVPRPAAFALEEIVAVRKEHMSKYDTFFDHESLANMKVIDVSKDGKQYLCEAESAGTSAGTVQILRASHLRRVDK